MFVSLAGSFCPSSTFTLPHGPLRLEATSHSSRFRKYNHIFSGGGQIAEWVPIISSALGVYMELLDQAPQLPQEDDLLQDNVGHWSYYHSTWFSPVFQTFALWGSFQACPGFELTLALLQALQTPISPSLEIQKCLAQLSHEQMETQIKQFFYIFKKNTGPHHLGRHCNVSGLPQSSSSYHDTFSNRTTT